MLQEIDEFTILKNVDIDNIEYSPRTKHILATIYLTADGIPQTFHVTGGNKCYALDEALEQVRLNTLIELNPTFNELGLEQPLYIEDGIEKRFINIKDFTDNLNTDLQMPFHEDYFNQLHRKAQELIGVIIHN